MENQGWIALDIDGTITLDKYSVPEPVTASLRKKHAAGWNIAIATGRPFRFAMMALSKFDFPFVLLPQNGSLALEMPSKNIIFKRYLPWKAIRSIEQASEGIESDFVIYTGIEKDDACYVRSHRFARSEWPAMEAWQERQKEQWQEVEQFTRELVPHFPLAKCFGSWATMEIIARRLRAMHRFQTALMKNPFDPDCAIILITDAKASKGFSLEEVVEIKGRGSLVIAAGDDENDLSLLTMADVKIAMSHAPSSLKDLAHIVAPPTEEMGIIHALEMAIVYGKPSV